jgi:type I restriction enzyme S subunit
MADFRTIRIGDFGRVVTGKTPPSAQPELFGDIHPFLTPTDIDGFARHIEPDRYLSVAGRDHQHRLMLPSRAVCVVCIGATIGKVCMTDRPSFTNQQINSVVVNEAAHDPDFVYHLLTTLRDELKSNAGGAATPIINKTAFSEIKVTVPPLPIQRRIAAILSAYDELIANSQRRIKILEAMARALYREWFVHFRFPGHEHHPRVPSALGNIPKGWEVKKLGDISSYINRGITPRYDDEGDSIVINQKCVRDQRLNLEPARRQSKATPNEKLVLFGDVLINSTGVGTLGRVAQVYENLERCTVDTHVTIARAERDIDLNFYGCSLFDLQETFERLGIGATGQTELGRAAISGIKLVVPPPDLQRHFGEATRGMRLAAVAYATQIQNLRRTRDLLLPRLLSGQINVETIAA